MTKNSTVTLIAALALPAILQASLLLKRVEFGRPDSVQLTIGDRMPPIVGLDETGNPVRIGWEDNTITVLLAFHRACPFCDEVAPAWRDWLATEHRSRMILMSDDRPRDALDYRDTNQWSGTLITLAPQSPTDLAAWLTRRTPWIYIVDSAGRLLYEGHGANLGAATAVLERAYQP